MSKSSGLGDQLYVGGADCSGDVGSISKITAKNSPLEVTGINKFAVERIYGLRDGELDFSGFFNKTGAHAELALYPTADTLVTYFRGTTIGDPAANCTAKQVSYDWKRSNKGALDFDVKADANGFGIEWGIQLTAGIRTDSTATNGTAFDRGANNSPAYPTAPGSDFEAGIGNWVLDTNATIAQTTAQAHAGTHSLAITSVAAGSASARSGTATATLFPTAVGAVHTCTGWVRAATSTRTVLLQVNWYDSGGSFLSNVNVTGASAVDSASAWTQLTGTAAAPSSAAFGALLVSVASTGAGGEVHYVDDVSVTAGLSAFGAQLYLQAFAVTGTSWTATVQHSPDNSTWTTLGAFTAVAAASTFQRLAVTGAVHRYVRVITAGTFTNAQLAVSAAINQAAVLF